MARSTQNEPGIVGQLLVVCIFVAITATALI